MTTTRPRRRATDRTPTEWVATLNMRNTRTPFVVTAAMARAGLIRALTAPPGAPDAGLVDLIGLQEWAGSERNAILRDLGRAVFVPNLRRWLPFVKPAGPRAAGYTWVRPALGGPWVGAKAARYVPRFVRSKTLAPATRLERVPGFRSLMGVSKVTVAGFEDLLVGGITVVIDGHLTRHVEQGGHYRRDLPKTIARHKREVRVLERVIAYHKQRGRRVYVTIDGNYDGLDLANLTACWDGHPKSATGGTLGKTRRPDVVYADDQAAEVIVVGTASDHDAVIAGYVR